MEDVLLIGVDGGATEAKAHAVDVDDLDHPTAFRLRPESAGRVYERVAEFAPLPVPEQLAQRDAGRIELSAAEAEQGRLYIRAAADAVLDVARQCATARAGSGPQRILVGIGMPGLKTPDGRGINTINNGPRMPNYLADFERMLADAGRTGADAGPMRAGADPMPAHAKPVLALVLAAPVAALGSDADYCGLGEEYAADGLFRDVQHAYYCGGGTGIADALKLSGQLVPFDRAKPWIQKSWQMPSALGPTFEKLVSASSLNRVWQSLVASAGLVASAPRGRRSSEQGPTSEQSPSGSEESARYPELAARAAHPLAFAWLDTAALVLAELLFERLCTVKNGRPPAAHRGDAYLKLSPDHEYRGLILDRLIIGQRIGLIYADPACRPLFGDKLDACLAALIADSGDAELAAACLDRAGALRPDFVRASKLRAAPALGAAVAAVRALASSTGLSATAPRHRSAGKPNSA